MEIRIRQEDDYYLASFLDSRRIIEVNEMGAGVLDRIFNQQQDPHGIAFTISQEHQISLRQAKQDISEFLKQVQEEVDPEVFNVIGQKQLKFPLGVELEIATGCNLRCQHCFQEFNTEEFMPTQRAIEIIEELARNNVFEVTLIGGEPFLHPGLFKILQSLEQNDLPANVVTNGTLIDEKMLEELSTLSRLVVIVSIDGTPAIHDYIRGKGVFEKADWALRQFQKYEIPTEVAFTLNATNMPVWRETLEYCEDMNLPLNFNFFKPFKPSHQGLIPNPKKYFDIVLELLRLRRERGYKVGLANAAIVVEILDLEPRYECRAATSGLVINVNGRMLTCPSLVAAGYYQKDELPIFDENFVETWRHHKIFEKFRQAGLRECQARAYIFSDDVQGYDPYGINAFKDYYKNKKAQPGD